MRGTVKPAFVRWLTDLMKADKIIAASEIDCLEKMCRKYDISPLDIENAQGLSLADACRIFVEDIRKRERTEILGIMKELSLSDGACAREEALLLLALSYCLEANAKMLSIKSANVDFVDSQVIFIEPHTDEHINDIIQTNFKRIANQMRIGGFDFIYIPNIAKHYREANENLLGKIIRYLAPTLSDAETDRVMSVMREMTTPYFKNEILRGKLNINLSITQPCLMIKIGNSYVSGELMSDFLLIDVNSNIVGQVDAMIEQFLEYQRCPTITIKNYSDAGGDFIYTGFYKTIFDLVTYRKGVRCHLYIKPERRRGRLEINKDSGHFIEMGLAETAFYLFLICESLSPRCGVSFINQGAKKLKMLQERFEQIYGLFRGSRLTAPDITDSNTRNRMLTIIRNALRENEFLPEKQLYIPNTDTSKIFVAIEPQLINLNDTLLTKTEFWANYQL